MKTATKDKVTTASILGAAAGTGLSLSPAFSYAMVNLPPPTADGALVGTIFQVAADKTVELAAIGQRSIDLAVKVHGTTVQQLHLLLGQSTTVDGVKFFLQKTDISTSVNSTYSEAYMIVQNLPILQPVFQIAEFGLFVLAISLTTIAIINRSELHGFVIQKIVRPAKQKLDHVRESTMDLLRTFIEQSGEKAGTY